MKKNIVLLGSNNSIGIEALKYFKENSNKFIVYGLSYDFKEKNLDYFISQIKEIKPKIIYIDNKDDFDYIKSKVEDDLFNFYISEDNFSVFIKPFEIDEVVSSLSGISSVKKILSSVYEFKDITLLNTSPLLYCGKIIVNEVKSKGVSLKVFSYPLYSLDFISKANNLKYIQKINLFSKSKNKDKNIKKNDYRDIQSYLKKFYSANKIRLVNDMFLINYIYDISPNQFGFYEQSKKIVNLDIKFNNGTSVVFAANLNLKSIFNYYYLDTENLLDKDLVDDTEKLSLTFSKINLKDERYLDLGVTALLKGGSLPIVYYITIELILDLIYNNKIKENVNIYNILKESIEDKSLYSKFPDLSSICSIEKKIYNKIMKKVN